MKVQYLIPVVATLGLFGCGNKPSSSPAEQKTAEAPVVAPTASDNQTNKLPADAPTYKVATTGTGAPLTFKDDKGNLTGIDIDIIKAIGQKEGFNIDLIPTTWSDLFVGLDKGKYDIVISGASWTEERESKYGVSQGYFFSPASFAYIDNGKQLNTLADLKNLKIGALADSKHEKTAREIGATEVSITKSGFETFANLVRGQIDVFIHDYADLKEYQKNYPDQKVIIKNIEDENQKGAYLIALTQKNNTELLAKINSGIEKLKAEGSIDKIASKYLDAPQSSANAETAK